MLSSRLIRLIEDHSDPITTRIMKEIRTDPRLAHVGGLPDADMRNRARDLLERLGHWLTECRDAEFGRFERVGRQRAQEAVPLQELVLSYLIIKERMLAFVSDQGVGSTVLDLYAQEELRRSASRFFDSVIYHLVRGYEAALAEARGRAAGA